MWVLGMWAQLAEEKKGRSSFLKNGSKRLLRIQVCVPPERAATALSKSFLLFFSKKKALLPSLPQAGQHRRAACAPQ
jgi:hypothetical protein